MKVSSRTSKDPKELERRRIKRLIRNGTYPRYLFARDARGRKPPSWRLTWRMIDVRKELGA